VPANGTEQKSKRASNPIRPEREYLFGACMSAKMTAQPSAVLNAFDLAPRFNA
jgi:hypothetical protein